VMANSGSNPFIYDSRPNYVQGFLSDEIGKYSGTNTDVTSDFGLRDTGAFIVAARNLLSAARNLLSAGGPWLLGICFLREAPERAIGTDRRARKWGLRGKRGRKRCFGASGNGVSVRKSLSPHR